MDELDEFMDVDNDLAFLVQLLVTFMIDHRGDKRKIYQWCRKHANPKNKKPKIKDKFMRTAVSLLDKLWWMVFPSQYSEYVVAHFKKIKAEKYEEPILAQLISVCKPLALTYSPQESRRGKPDPNDYVDKAGERYRVDSTSLVQGKSKILAFQCTRFGVGRGFKVVSDCILQD